MKAALIWTRSDSIRDTVGLTCALRFWSSIRLAGSAEASLLFSVASGLETLRQNPMCRKQPNHLSERFVGLPLGRHPGRA